MTRKLLGGAAWATLGTVGSRIALFGCGLVAARVLSPESYGGLGIVQTTASTAAVFANFGLGLTATRFVAAHRHGDPSRAAAIVRLTLRLAAFTGLLALLALVLCAPTLETYFGLESIASSLALAGALVMLTAMSGAASGALAGYGEFRASARGALLGGAASLALTFPFARLWGVFGATGALTLGMLVNLCVNRIALGRLSSTPRQRKAETDKAELGLLIRFTVPAVLSGLIWAPANWVASSLLVRAPGGASEFAVFTAANQWFMAISFLPVVLGQVLIPLLTEELNAGRSDTALGVLKRTTGLYFVCGAGLLLAVSLAGGPMMALYGPDYAERTLVLIFAVAAAGITAVQAPLNQVVQAGARMWWHLGLNVIWGAVFLASATSWLEYGADGVAAARVVAYGIHTLGLVLLARAILRRSEARAVAVEGGE